jgi:dTDP-4-dehydrorhamnose reductase
MILLTGAAGYVGTLLRKSLGRRHELLCVDRRPVPGPGAAVCDLADGDAVRRFARDIRPDAVIHAAGIKDIAYCEKHPDEARRINCDTTKNVAAAFGDRSRVIYISTDYVFRGDRGNYSETDAPDPLTVYGKSKLCGETKGAALAGSGFTVLRTGALYDLDAAFPRFLTENLSASRAVDCFTDAVYSPTYYKDLVDVLERLLAPAAPGERVYHACGEPLTRYAFARAFAEAFGFDPRLVRPAPGCGGGGFFFPDLSMVNGKTRSLLGSKRTGVREALAEMRREAELAGH